MARFYARFDSGSPGGWNTPLDSEAADTGFFDRRYVSAGSASAALLRDGLIASRSAVSTDVYVDLDDGNQDGSKGIYFPPDSGPFSTNNSTFVSWSNAYTSSFDGIKTPTSNEYGYADSVPNYSKRPTASVTSGMTNIIGPATPVDSIGVAYSTYTAATTAVKAVLDAIQSGGPYGRLGNYPNRTLLSVWHDPDLQYFAWDDFTPAQPLSFGVTDPGNISDEYYYTNDFNYTFSWGPGYTYKADAKARPIISASLHPTGSTVSVQDLTATLLSEGVVTYNWLIDRDNIIPANGNYEVDANLKLRDSKLYNATPSLNSDGTPATITNGGLLKLTRLYANSIAGPIAGYDTVCANYGGPVTRYATVAEGNELDGADIYVYVNTDTASPSGISTGWYYAVNIGKVYQCDGAGVLTESPGSTTCSGDPGSTTTAGSTTTTTTTNPET